MIPILLVLGICKAASDADDQADRMFAGRHLNVGAEAPSSEAGAWEAPVASAPTTTPGAGHPSPEVPAPGSDAQEGGGERDVTLEQVTPAVSVPAAPATAGEPTLPTTAQVLLELAEGVDFGNHLGLRGHLLNAALACDGFPLACRQLDEAGERIAALKQAGREFLPVALDRGASLWELREAGRRFQAILDAEDGDA